ncbi:hypothetical protein [Clostridium perfringens]|uniref:hypothetical protein n=1 Tax=Clostridium perfringens TaxID=1502 RepID=UPI0036A5E35C
MEKCLNDYLNDITNKVEKYVGDELGNLIEYILGSDIFFGEIRINLECCETHRWYGFLSVRNKSDLENLENKTLLNSKITRIKPFSKKAYIVDIERNYEQDMFIKRHNIY